MIPYIKTPWGSIPIFVIMITAGVLSFLWVLHIDLKKENALEEEMFIFPKVIYSMFIAYIFAGLFDAVFKYGENGRLIFSGITFYGGLIGAILFMFLMLFFSRQKTKYSIKEWFDKLTIPLIFFHIFGRLGCFLAGCCYGKETESLIGVRFPDNELEGVFHHGSKCYPTQLFEVFALMIIIMCVIKAQNKFKLYLVLYAISRFIIEFIRGDNRGGFLAFLSPAQTISVVIILIMCIKELLKTVKKGRNE